MKIFLTGGTGFIGSHFINEAHLRGFEIVALRRSNKSRPRIKLTKEPKWVDKNFKDVDKKDFFDSKILVHLAAHSANVPYDNLQNCIEFNVNQPLKLFYLAREAGIKKFIVAGSCFEYGKSANHYEFIPSNAPLEPIASYPTSKALSSLCFRHFSVVENIPLVYNRIFQVFGEGESENRLWPSIKRSAELGLDLEMTKGEQIRDFIYVKDVVNKFLDQCLDDFTLQSGQPRFINIGSGKPQSILEFTNFWWEYYNAKGKLKIGELDYRDQEFFRFVPEL